jgi:hypothetical protein
MTTTLSFFANPTKLVIFIFCSYVATIPIQNIMAHAVGGHPGRNCENVLLPSIRVIRVGILDQRLMNALGDFDETSALTIRLNINPEFVFESGISTADKFEIAKGRFKESSFLYDSKGISVVRTIATGEVIYLDLLIETYYDAKLLIRRLNENAGGINPATGNPQFQLFSRATLAP